MRNPFLLLLAGSFVPFVGEDPDPAPFPRAWLGTWRGSVEVHSLGLERPGFTVELEVEPTEDPERWSWITRFEAPPGNQERR